MTPESVRTSKVHFDRIVLSWYDRIEVMDAANTVIQTFDDSYKGTDVWTDYVPGRVVKIRFVTSSDGQDWGFRIDAIE